MSAMMSHSIRGISTSRIRVRRNAVVPGISTDMIGSRPTGGNGPDGPTSSQTRA